MNFSEKLDLLMNISNTSNSSLARTILIDASAISRLRRGIRTPSPNATYIEPMAQYFARTCQNEYQKAALFEVIKKNNPLFVPAKDEALENIIYEWLCSKATAVLDSIDDSINNHNDFYFKKTSSDTEVDIEQITNNIKSEIITFYGNVGKQKAVLTLLSLVLKTKKSQTLLLYSSENMDWMLDPNFLPKWASLMTQIINRGNRIKIIHSTNRTFDEIISAIQKWIPLYMTGAIDPYYYPKTRDGLFRQTFFIAPETAALESSSISDKTENSTSFVYTNQNTINSLVEKFNVFLFLCRPLMRIFTPHEKREEYLTILDEFENEKANTIIKTDSLSDITIPLNLIKGLLKERTNIKKEKIFAHHIKRIEGFTDNLVQNTFTEIFTLPNLELILDGKVPVNFSDIFDNTKLFYTAEEYANHLKHLIKLLTTYENYHIILTEDSHLEGSMIYVKEDVGVIVSRGTPKLMVFAINENNMTAAFWDYMDNFLNKIQAPVKDKSQIIKELNAFVDSIEARL